MNQRSYRIPAVTARLGAALDLVTESSGKRTRHDLGDDWQLLTDADAIDRTDGRARLYLVRSELSDKVPNRLDRASAIRTFERWHDRRPEFIGGLHDLPDKIGQPIGRAVTIGYRSDKWKQPGKTIDYQHDFRDGRPPLVYVDQTHNPRAFLLTGGSIRVTERGIE